MTRGRRKDMTIPPSRALLQQRDYRARKAQYLSDLEDRVKNAEEDNARLRQEIEMLQKRLGSRPSPPPPHETYNPEVVHAASELMRQLSATTVSISRFQQVAMQAGPSSASLSTPPCQYKPSLTLATPAYTPSPVASLPSIPALQLPSPPRSLELPPIALPERPRHREIPPPPSYPISSRSLPSGAFGPPPSTCPHPNHGYSSSRYHPSYDRRPGYTAKHASASDDDREDEPMDSEDDSPVGPREGDRARPRFAQRMSDVRSSASASSSGREDGETEYRRSQ